MKYREVLALALGTLLPVVALGQTERLLKPDEINEKALVELLAPEEAGAPVKRRTRSINVTREESAQASAKPAAASLLITFETNSAGLTPAGKQSLDVVGRALSSEKLSSYRFAIEGHSDPRGGEAYNMRLSQSRAESVVGYLAENHQIQRGRLTPVGKGPTQLLNPARPEAPENRRVTIKRLDN
ncbi:MAG: OmpA family protein [Candidatus Accumulibacter sp.]|uniref:OmpA family protein n=1 Tax=Accumulibacter sp. TaxID=2053492 RepID=UPI0028789CD2|nr:OmpA family protein [Accumulibacter sp.]MDS4013099.1 OmpA family protein [Accumulibacter sp.]